jgi:hypothetical protein
LGQATGVGLAARIHGGPKQPNQNPSTKETGLDANHQARISPEGRGKNCFLDILFHRVSVIEMFERRDKPA